MYLVFLRNIDTKEPRDIKAHYFETLVGALLFLPEQGREASDVIKIQLHRDVTWPRHRTEYPTELKPAYIPQIGDTLMTTCGCITITSIDHTKPNPYSDGRNWYSEEQIQHMSFYCHGKIGGVDVDKVTEAELTRLRKAIEEAPYAEMNSEAHDVGGVVNYHKKLLDEWKRNALKD